MSVCIFRTNLIRHAVDPHGEIDDVVFRLLRHSHDFERAVALQHRTWGPDFDDVVSAATLQVAQKIGGIAAGAFDGDEIVAAVFGMLGRVDGELVHWSHMLAVHPERRNRGIGRAMKLFQRDRVLKQGIDVMMWTFEPLESRNAFLNLNRLGAEIAEYVRDMYGSGSTSPLFSGIGTDRLVVRWNMRSERTKRAMQSPRTTGAPEPPLHDVPVVNPGGAAPQPATIRHVESAKPSRLRIEIPVSIQQVKTQHPSVAVRWRRSTRSSFERLLKLGYVVDRIIGVEGRSFYLLQRSP